MQQCIRCQRVGFWFQFFSAFMGTHTECYDVCKRCANQLRYFAVAEFVSREP